MPVDSLEERIALLVKEEVAIVPYDPRWPTLFARERDHLASCLPRDIVRRIEHFGSTAVPGLCAKPIVDILVEVTSLDDTRARIVPILEAQGYEYFWRPTSGDDVPPFYAWFIKRDANGERTHHIHMVESWFEHWDGLIFRDYLIQHNDIAREYVDLKTRLAGLHRHDREAYTLGKTAFIKNITKRAKQSCSTLRQPRPLDTMHEP
ncbi:MAG: GrpB family protein [Candidatus Hydrogenedentes bacterium]|nr:GrpB family protein [Candidatus Hydrogenedentota bacterium]